jgi:hypothetical protein
MATRYSSWRSVGIDRHRRAIAFRQSSTRIARGGPIRTVALQLQVGSTRTSRGDAGGVKNRAGRRSGCAALPCAAQAQSVRTARAPTRCARPSERMERHRLPTDAALTE